MKAAHDTPQNRSGRANSERKGGGGGGGGGGGESSSRGGIYVSTYVWILNMHITSCLATARVGPSVCAERGGTEALFVLTCHSLISFPFKAMLRPCRQSFKARTLFVPHPALVCKAMPAFFSSPNLLRHFHPSSPRYQTGASLVAYHPAECWPQKTYIQRNTRLGGCTALPNFASLRGESPVMGLAK